MRWPSTQVRASPSKPITEGRRIMNNTPYRAHRDDLRCIRAAQVALGWVVLFSGFHLYWYLGGSFASPGKLPGEPRSLVGWTFQVFVWSVRRRDHPAVGRRPSCAPTRYSGFTSTLGTPGSAYQQSEIAVISTRTLGTHRPQPTEPNSDINVQVRKGHRMSLASVMEPHTSMSTINSRSFRYVGVC